MRNKQVKRWLRDESQSLMPFAATEPSLIDEITRQEAWKAVREASADRKTTKLAAKLAREQGRTDKAKEKVRKAALKNPAAFVEAAAVPFLTQESEAAVAEVLESDPMADLLALQAQDDDDKFKRQMRHHQCRDDELEDGQGHAETDEQSSPAPTDTASSTLPHNRYHVQINDLEMNREWLRTPSGPMVDELLPVGSLVRSNYETGGVVVDVQPHTDGDSYTSFTVVFVDKGTKPNAKGRFKESDLRWYNDFVGVDGRILHEFKNNDDELFVVDEVEELEVKKTVVDMRGENYNVNEEDAMAAVSCGAIAEGKSVRAVFNFDKVEGYWVATSSGHHVVEFTHAVARQEWEGETFTYAQRVAMRAGSQPATFYLGIVVKYRKGEYVLDPSKSIRMTWGDEPL